MNLLIGLILLSAKPLIASSITPVTSIVKEIGGNCFSYFTVTPPNANPHSFEAPPSTVKEISNADIFFYVGEIEPDGKVLCKVSKHCIKLTDFLPIRPDNPHIWLSPSYMDIIIDSVSRVLTEYVPSCGDSIESRKKLMKRRIDSIFNNAKTTLARCHNQPGVVLYHPAFADMFKFLGIKNIIVLAAAPPSEPSAKEVLTDIKSIKKGHYLFAVKELNTPGNVINSVAAETNLKIIELSPLLKGKYTDAMSLVLKKVENAANCSR